MILGAKVTRAQLERGIYNALRKKIIANGRLPDKIEYNDPDKTADENQADYLAAIETLRSTLETSGTNIIDIRGVGAPQSRDGARENMIYIARINKIPGSIRGFGKTEFEAYEADDGNGGTKDAYKEYQLPEGNWDIMYSIRYFTSSVETDRDIENIITEALGQNRYIPTTNDDFTDGPEVNIMYQSDVDLSGGKYFERVFRYTAKDIWLENYELISEGISPLYSIDVIIGETTVITVGEEFPPEPE